jgi:hypothetical protein
VAKENVQKIGAIEAAVEGVKAVAPGLSFKDIISDVGAELKQMGAHGAHELAAAIFNGSPYVMYPRGNHDGGKEQETPAVEPQAIEERSREGRSM